MHEPRAHEHRSVTLGESGNGDGLGCRNNNFDTEKRVICNAAKVVCNIPGKDYCMTSLLVNCMKSIGQMCPSSDKKRPNCSTEQIYHGEEGAGRRQG